MTGRKILNQLIAFIFICGFGSYGQNPVKKSLVKISSDPYGYINGHGYVDLGLPSGLKWATCNVGASSPLEYGNYYAWGETKTKTTYNTDNSLAYNKSKSKLLSAGIIDSSGNLTPRYDAARANWGDCWRMPTVADGEELLKNCKLEWITEGNVSGCRITGPNGNSIFLPAAGAKIGDSFDDASVSGYFWSSSLGIHCKLHHSSSKSKSYYSYVGLSVRPVLDLDFSEGGSGQSSMVEHKWVDLGLPSGLKWATCNVGASSPSENGNYYAWGETKTKTTYNADNSLTHRVPSSMEIEAGIVDFSGTLTSLYDAAQVNWGGSWRMPTSIEFSELFAHCNCEWIAQGHYIGYKVTSVNGNSIFLPAAGKRSGDSLDDASVKGYYWCSNHSATGSGNAFGLDRVHGVYHLEINHYCGVSVRPVLDVSEGGSGQRQAAKPGETQSQTTKPARATPVTTTTVNRKTSSSADQTTTAPTSPGKATSDSIAGHGYVDLGLPSGLKWATCNVGASSPSEYGNYYAWGEIETKTSYDDSNSLTYGKSDAELFWAGIIDSLGNLTPQYDVAQTEWGDSWRMPTKTELEELCNNCKWTPIVQDGHNGYKVTGPNGNSIFLPAASGCTGDTVDSGESVFYWGSTRDNGIDGITSTNAYALVFIDDEGCEVSELDRYCGFPIRPVSE